MGHESTRPADHLDRRRFLLGAGAGLAASPLTWLAMRGVRTGDPDPDRHRSFTGRSVEVRNPAFAMPGPFPGRVVEVRHPGAVRDDFSICHPCVKTMMDRGMCELTGAGHPTEAWRRFFEPGDVVGIKVNPVGRKYKPTDVGAISSPEVLIEVVQGLRSAGVRPRDIIVFERYADMFRDAGYEAVLRERSMEGVRWHAPAARYTDTQLDISGNDLPADRRDRDPHVVGYDPDVFVHMGYSMPPPYHDAKDDRRFRSHLAVIVTRMINKLVTIPVLKDHRSAGVTMALKNLSHGMNNNVARSHPGTFRRRGGGVSGPNQCNTFIPTAAGQLPTRQKAALHIMDGLIGVYEGGPGAWNRTWGTWRRKSLFFATDPVAMDHVGWDIIDAKRAREGWQPVAQMGSLHHPAAVGISSRLAALACRAPLEAASASMIGQNLPGNQETESLDRRQPEHVILAGTIGMGVFDAAGIDYRRVHLQG